MSSYEWRERAHREGRSTNLDGIPRWALSLIDRYHRTTIHPEPPRDSGEADAVNGPTALRTHRDNTLERSTAGPDARP